MVTIAVFEEPHAVAARPRRRSGLLRFFRGNKAGVVGAVITLCIILVAICAPLLVPQQPTRVNLSQRMKPPGAEHVLGTDELGRDLLSRIIWGARVSLQIGFASVLISAAIGVTLGLIAGFFGGWMDRVFMGLMDVLLSFPLLLLAMGVIAVLGQNLVNVLLAVAIAGVPQYARTVRASVLALRQQDFIQAAIALGAKSSHIIWRHVAPNVLAPIVIMATIRVAGAIMIEASLSFLGLSDPTVITWGSIVSAGRPYLQNAPWISTLGGLAITLTVLGLNLLGDGLRDAFDPRLRRTAG